MSISKVILSGQEERPLALPGCLYGGNYLFKMFDKTTYHPHINKLELLHCMMASRIFCYCTILFN